MSLGRTTTLLQLIKYNTSQRILEELADAESRSILFSSIIEERSAAELAEMLHIPLSSVYKKLNRLRHLALISVTRTVMDTNHKRNRMYKSNISEAIIHIKNRTPELEPTLDPILVANKPGSVNESPVTLPETEFDVSRLIMDEMGNARSRAVLFSIRDKPKGSRTISLELQISLSTTQDILERLEYLGLAEKWTVDGEQTSLYRSCISEASIIIKDAEPVLGLVGN